MPKPPAKKQFTVIIERTAKVRTTLELEGANRKTVQKEALKLVQEEPFPLEKAEIKEKIIRIG